MAVKDGGGISTQQRKTFIALGSCLLPGIKKRETKKNKTKQNKKTTKICTRKCDFNLFKKNTNNERLFFGRIKIIELILEIDYSIKNIAFNCLLLLT